MELSSREQRIVMLETQTPAYATSLKARRQLDLHYRRARNLRKAFADAGLNMPVNVRAEVPLQHKYVSGLNVPSNWSIVVGRQAIKAHRERLERAKTLLRMRNA